MVIASSKMSDVPAHLEVPILRKVRYVIELNNKFYPATSAAHLCTVLAELGVETDANLLWVVYRHAKGQSKIGRALLCEYPTLRFHVVP